LEHERPHDVISGADNAFGTTILRISMRTRHVENNTMSVKKSVGGRIVELTTIITLDSLDGGSKLCGNI
jgi:hypothetical protein